MTLPARRVERRRRPPHPEEELLQNLFRFSRVAQDPLGEAHEAGRVPVVELGERVGVPAFDPGDQGTVGFGDGAHFGESRNFISRGPGANPTGARRA